MRLIYFFVFALFAIANISCEKSGNSSPSSIINTWGEIEPVGIIQYAGSSYETLKINPDSTFTLRYFQWGDVISDSCDFVYTYFIKGNCTANDSMIYFNGCYSDSTFINCIPECRGIIDYTSHYKYKLTTDSLILNPGHEWTSRRDLISK